MLCSVTCRLNDVVVVDEDKFYYTNFFYEYMFELTFRWVRWGSLGFFNGTSTTLIETGMFIPNGAILSKDGRYKTAPRCSLLDRRLF
jgi:sugar lactone lactonase YvrE